MYYFGFNVFVYAYRSNPTVFELTINETEGMLRDSIDLDQIKEDTLVTLLLNSSDFKLVLKGLLKKPLILLFNVWAGVLAITRL